MDQGGLKPDGYLPRIADMGVSRLLDEFGAVEIVGPMWCGKTWTSLSFASSVTRIGREAERSLARADPTTALVCGGESRMQSMSSKMFRRSGMRFAIASTRWATGADSSS